MRRVGRSGPSATAVFHTFMAEALQRKRVHVRCRPTVGVTACDIDNATFHGKVDSPAQPAPLKLLYGKHAFRSAVTGLENAAPHMLQALYHRIRARRGVNK